MRGTGADHRDEVVMLEVTYGGQNVGVSWANPRHHCSSWGSGIGAEIDSPDGPVGASAAEEGQDDFHDFLLGRVDLRLEMDLSVLLLLGQADHHLGTDLSVLLLLGRADHHLGTGLAAL